MKKADEDAAEDAAATIDNADHQIPPVNEQPVNLASGNDVDDRVSGDSPV